MTEYRLFISKKDGREVIAPVDHNDYWNCDWLTGTRAESWLDAKQRMGFELTATQQWLLDRQMARAA